MYKCDHGNCKLKPYVERLDSKTHSWCYLCRYHYIIDRIRTFMNHRDDVGYGDAETNTERLDRTMEDLWDTQGEMYKMSEEIDKIYKVMQDNLDVLEKRINDLQEQINNMNR